MTKLTFMLRTMCLPAVLSIFSLCAAQENKGWDTQEANWGNSEMGGQAAPCGRENCTCGCCEGMPCTCGSTPSPRTDGAYYDNCAPISDCADCEIAQNCCLKGTWLPEGPLLFRPFMADPHELTYSVGWRFNDQVFVKNVIDVSYYDTISFYRWCNFYGGEMQIDLEGALWAIFDPLHDSSPLINADYYVGIPLTYARGNWSFRLRGYHISSHIGDEFLLNHPGFDRRNASAEYLDFFVSNDLTKEIRLYGGIGYIVAQDEEFKCSRFYAEGGAEVRISRLGFTSCNNQLYGLPFLAMHFRYRKDYKNHLDSTYALGYEFGKLCGSQRRLRIYMLYHDGYSAEGQFCKRPTNYFSLRTSYGF